MKNCRVKLGYIYYRCHAFNFFSFVLLNYNRKNHILLALTVLLSHKTVSFPVRSELESFCHFYSSKWHLNNIPKYSQ